MVRIRWQRQVFNDGKTRRRGQHYLPDKFTIAQAEAIKDMLNIANWFMDVRATIITEKPEASK